MIKKYFKIVLSFILVIVTVLSSFLFVNAHSGRTDSNGGHYNHSTGEYHYHHGYPAHDHPNGVCPYKKQPVNDIEDETTTTKIENNNNSDYWIKHIPIIVTIFLIIIIYIIVWIYLKKR